MNINFILLFTFNFDNKTILRNTIWLNDIILYLWEPLFSHILVFVLGVNLNNFMHNSGKYMFFASNWAVPQGAFIAVMIYKYFMLDNIFESGLK